MEMTCLTSGLVIRRTRVNHASNPPQPGPPQPGCRSRGTNAVSLSPTSALSPAQCQESESPEPPLRLSFRRRPESRPRKAVEASNDGAPPPGSRRHRRAEQPNRRTDETPKALISAKIRRRGFQRAATRRGNASARLPALQRRRAAAGPPSRAGEGCGGWSSYGVRPARGPRFSLSARGCPHGSSAACAGSSVAPLRLGKVTVAATFCCARTDAPGVRVSKGPKQ
jgi:hypothetical protein